MCDYRTKYFCLKDKKYREYICPHDGFETTNQDGKTYCIFHRKENKDTIDFRNELEKFYEGGKSHEFIGFIFPKDFNFQEFYIRTCRKHFMNAIFYKAKFLCYADFNSVEFNCETGTDFGRAKFFKGASFRSAKFCGKGVINFYNTKFLGTENVSFYSTEFLCFNEVSFQKTKFTEGGSVSFYLTKFEGIGCVRFDMADFSKCKQAYFIDVEFSMNQEVSFWKADFSGSVQVRFTGSTFNNAIETIFTNVDIGEDAKITFKKVDLNRCRLIGTDLLKINFYNVFWTGRKYMAKFPRFRIKIYDELFSERGQKIRYIDCVLQYLKISKIPLKLYRRIGLNRLREKCINQYYFKSSNSKLSKKLICLLNTFYNWVKVVEAEKEQNHSEVSLLYSKLLQNYENSNRAHEAGDFFAGLMEMRRRESLEKRNVRIILWFYRLFSLYGERPNWALGWLLIVILFSGLLNLNSGIKLETSKNEEPIQMEVFNMTTYFDPTLRYQFYENYPKALSVSLNIFTLNRVKSYYILNDRVWGPFILTAQMGIFTIFISLFILAMNRKFRRRKD